MNPDERAGRLHIRVAVPEDAPVLRDIYAYYVKETAVTFEVDVPTVEEFAGRIARFGKTHPFLVAERRGPAGTEVAGYAYAHPYYGYGAYAWCAELTVYLRRDACGQGVGSRLYDALERVLRAMGVRTLYACVTVPGRESSLVPPTSIRFHEARGYRVIGRFEACGFKLGHWFDTVWMERLLSCSPGAPTPIVAFSQLEGREDLLA